MALPLNIINAQPASLYFSGVAPGATGPDLYRLGADGSFQAIPVTPDSAGSHAGENGGYAVFNGKLYFFADTAAGQAQLLTLNPDGSVTPVAGISGVQNVVDPQFGAVTHFTAFDGKLFFVGQGSQGVDVYSIDANGTVAGLDTSAFSDPPVLHGDDVNTFSNDNGFAVFDGGLYFSAYSIYGNPSLFRLDAGSNTPVNIDPFGASFVGEDGGFFVYNNELLFNAFVSTDQVFILEAGSTTPVPLTDLFGYEIDHTFLHPANLRIRCRRRSLRRRGRTTAAAATTFCFSTRAQRRR